MNEGKIIEYIDQKRIIISVCLKDRMSKLQLLTSGNHEVSISPKRALLLSSASLSIARPREELVKELKEIEKERIELAEQVSVQELWELTYEEQREFTFVELAELAFCNHVTDAHISALVRRLFADRIYFKLKDASFVPHSPEKVAQLAKAIEAAELREKEISQGGWFIKELVNGRTPQDPPLKEKIIEVLVQLALYGKDAPDFRLGREMFARAGIKDISQAHNLLVKLNVWDEDENLDLHRLRLPTEFSEPLMEEAERIAQKEPDLADREDVTGLPIFTIDGPFTRDFDDALSLEPLDGGYRLGVHIADVSAFIKPNSRLDGEAFARATSIYLPATQIPMLPPKLSNDALSLVKEVKRLAVTLFCDFDENWSLIGHRFARTVVKVEKQLTYDEVNGAYMEEPVLALLYRLAQSLRKKRAMNGAMILPLPEVHVVFNNNSHLQVHLIEQDSPARLMVSECMIFYNWLTAKFAAQAGIPILYRGQEPPQERLPFDESNYIYYVFQQRRKLHPLSIDTKPQPHSGIGVDAYTNATSPLRRYMDLLVQRQILAVLTGTNPAYSESRIEEIGLSVQQTLKAIDVMKRNRMRYWILKYLAQRIGERFSALVFQKLRSKYLVILTDLLFIGDLQVPNSREISPGEKITVAVKKSDPHTDVLILELAL
ncbi:MAG: RNB domain-containing ribonuclease [Thermodesulfobacteriota bacterium]